MEPAGGAIDLSNCDREPIQTPGAIQPHHALLIVDRPSDRILAASTNIAQFINQSAHQVVHTTLGDVFTPSVTDTVRAAAYSLKSSNDSVTVDVGSAEHLALLHVVGETLFIEFETRPRDEQTALFSVRNTLKEFAAEDDILELCALAARRIKTLIGYDRVMVYRFDPEGHGKVVAEEKINSLESYLNRHYPASDIPRQARELYRETMVRTIADVDYLKVAIEPAVDPRNGKPWDLGKAISRSVSPIHIQYLKNMGVTATLTISLLRDGELWGLIACHHYSKRCVDATVRAAAEAVGYGLAGRLSHLENAHESRAAADAHAAVLEFAFRSRSGIKLFVRDRELHRRLGIDGAGLFTRSETVTAGAVPPLERFTELADWLRERAGSEQFARNSLAKLEPRFEDIAQHASGIYARSNGEDVLILLRGEHAETIDWGGDPNKPVNKDGERLTPRGSFALWQETVRFRALPWEPWTLSAIDNAIRIVQTDLQPVDPS